MLWRPSFPKTGIVVFDCIPIDRVDDFFRLRLVIANHISRVGPAIRLAPRAKLLLDVHDDIAMAQRQAALLDGGTEQDAAIAEQHAQRVQATVLAIPDLSTHVNQSEEERLGPFCRKSVVVLPRVYVSTTAQHPVPRFDILIVGNQHIFNIELLRWFLGEVWKPYLGVAGISVAVAGRAAAKIDVSQFELSLSHFLGFVEDLDDLRASCRMTVVPDQGGTGIPVKI